MCFDIGGSGRAPCRYYLNLKTSGPNVGGDSRLGAPRCFRDRGWI